ncbi:MAG TPA: hypothetical protein VMH40_16385 [Myxococcaceae bacterium]|nr:hypothetical protein [Myxococcaceae bacterium]
MLVAGLVWALLLGKGLSPSGIPALSGPVQPDGRVDAREWAGALDVQFEGLRVRLGTRGDVLAVAVELEGPGIATLLLGTRDRIWVLHASAALGTGQYHCAGDGTCVRRRDLAYRCRDPGGSPAAERCRTEFRTTEGWVANVAPQAGLAREFLVDRSHFGRPDQPLFLAVTGLVLPERPARWPSGLDDASSVKLQQGFLGERARFSVDTWFPVRP